MSDETVVTETLPAAKPAPKAKARKTEAKAAKAKAKPAANGKPADKHGVSPQRAAVILALAKGSGSLPALVKRSKLPERAVYHHLWHLRQDGFVRSFDLPVDGGAEMQFELKASGRKLADKLAG